MMKGGCWNISVESQYYSQDVVYTLYCLISGRIVQLSELSNLISPISALTGIPVSQLLASWQYSFKEIILPGNLELVNDILPCESVTRYNVLPTRDQQSIFFPSGSSWIPLVQPSYSHHILLYTPLQYVHSWSLTKTYIIRLIPD